MSRGHLWLSCRLCVWWAGLLLALSSFSVVGEIVSSNTPTITQCFECMSKAGGVDNPLCPAHGDVDTQTNRLQPCKGQCFTRTDQNDTDLVYRGCTAVWVLPEPLPSQGCYRRQADHHVWCLCSTDGCNGVQMGTEGNITLEAFAQIETEKENEANGNDTSGAVLPPSFIGHNSSGVLQCWQCQSHSNGGTYPQCPVHAQVDVNIVFIGNCTDRCYMKSFTDSLGTEVIHRGCTAVWVLPEPLPSQGCYRRQADHHVWCFCSTDGCNGVKMGEAGNMTLEEYVEKERDKITESGNETQAVLPPSLIDQGPQEVLQCWECQSYREGVTYAQCPVRHQVDVNRVYIGDCLGRCYMHNSHDEQAGVNVMYRGCTTALAGTGLPDPLPDDGCYTWRHDEVWCVCSHDGCNGVKLGNSSVRFNAHITSSGCGVCGTASTLLAAFLLILQSL